MSSALQIALFLASMAVVLFVSLVIPLSFLLFRCVRGIARQMGEVKADRKELIQDSRTIAQNISAVTSQVNDQLDELDSIVGIIRRWSELADHFVEEVGATVEVPLLNATCSIKAFLQAWRFIVRLIGANKESHK